MSHGLAWLSVSTEFSRVRAVFHCSTGTTTCTEERPAAARHPHGHSQRANIESPSLV